MKPDRFFEHDSLQDRKTIKRYLKALVDGISKGALRLSDGHGEIILRPDGLIHLQVQGSEARERAHVTISLSWRRAGGAAPDSDSGPLTITSS